MKMKIKMLWGFGNFIPDFTAPDQDGNIVSSAELLGKKTVVYFYPNILRPALRDAQQKLAAWGTIMTDF